jgi:D-beta-D-heptose 7-phosphate kinase/D-beta-D-heptose 1-phosphate adenosyltransferase
MAANVRLNLLALDLNVDFVTNKKTITKTRYIDSRSKQHLLRVDDEPKIDQWDGNLPGNLDDYDLVVISDYNKGFLSYENIVHIIGHTLCPVFIDTKKTELSEFSADHVFVKINELEYKSARSLPKNLIVTLGERGAVLKCPEGEFTYPTHRVEVVDVCGCGDTFLSTLATTYVLTDNIDLAIKTANSASSITVQHSGNYAPKFNEILNARH